LREKNIQEEFWMGKQRMVKKPKKKKEKENKA